MGDELGGDICINSNAGFYRYFNVFGLTARDEGSRRGACFWNRMGISLGWAWGRGDWVYHPHSEDM